MDITTIKTKKEEVLEEKEKTQIILIQRRFQLKYHDQYLKVQKSGTPEKLFEANTNVFRTQKTIANGTIVSYGTKSKSKSKCLVRDD